MRTSSMCFRFGRFSTIDPDALTSVPHGAEAEALPVAIRSLGPWTGGAEGEVNRLRFPYRMMLGEQGFVVLTFECWAGVAYRAPGVGKDRTIRHYHSLLHG